MPQSNTSMNLSPVLKVKPIKIIVFSMSGAAFSFLVVVRPTTLSSGLLCIQIYPDSNIHGAYLGPTGTMWAPCGPREPCYLGKLSWSLIHVSPTHQDMNKILATFSYKFSWKYMYFYSISLKIISKLSIDIKPALIHMMLRYWTGDKPLIEKKWIWLINSSPCL